MCRKRDAGAHVRLVFLQRPSEYNTPRNFRNSPNFPRDGDTRSPALSPLRPSTTLSPARSKWKKGRDKKETARDSARVRCARRRGGPNAIHRILKSRFLQVARDNGPVYKYEPIPKFETITRRREEYREGEIGEWTGRRVRVGGLRLNWLEIGRGAPSPSHRGHARGIMRGIAKARAERDRPLAKRSQ